jgi:hypothetical protein
MAAGPITAQQIARGMAVITAARNGRQEKLPHPTPRLANVYCCLMRIFYLANLRQNMINERMECPVDINKSFLSIEENNAIFGFRREEIIIKQQYKNVARQQ